MEFGNKDFRFAVEMQDRPSAWAFASYLIDLQQQHNDVLNLWLEAQKFPPARVAVRRWFCPRWLFQKAVKRGWSWFYVSYPRA